MSKLETLSVILLWEIFEYEHAVVISITFLKSTQHIPSSWLQLFPSF